MPAGVDGWIELADVVVACPDPQTAERLGSALSRLGLTGSERERLDTAIARRSDPAGRYLRHLVASAPAVDEPADPGGPPPAEAAMEQALELADRLEGEPALALGPARAGAVGTLEALPAHRAGSLVQRLLDRHDDPSREAAVLVATTAPMTRLPAEQLIRGARDLSEPDLRALAAVLSRAPRRRLLQSLATVLSATPSASLVHLVELLGQPARPTTAAPPEGWAGAEPTDVGALGGPASEGEHGADSRAGTEGMEGADSWAGSDGAETGVDGALGTGEDIVYRGGSLDGAGSEGRDGGTGAAPGPTDGSTTAERPAFPRLDLKVEPGRRPDVVVVDQPFTVVVGLGPRPSHGIVSSGAVPADQPVDVVLTYDPDSLDIEGAVRHRLEVTSQRPHPTVEVTVTARYLSDPPQTRRIGAYYLQGTQVVGVAWRRFVAVDEEHLVDGAPAPPDSERALLDLGALLGQDAPDLVLAVCRADTGSGDRWVWSTYTADPSVRVSDAPEVATLDGEVAEFATAARRAVQFSTNAYSDFLTLAGRAQRIGSSIPATVHAALTATLDAARSREAGADPPTVLLLTEELIIPWELGSISPPVTTPWGGSSPFLGAHVAIGRWPLTARKPRPVPRTAVDVRSVAVVTADYTGVPGWGRLEAALAEADDVTRIFDPAAVRVDPDLVAVIDLLRGTPPAELLHMALHGQFDQAGEQEGIVLLDRSADGTVRPQFLTPVQLETGRLSGGPFVFLNACQVGSDERVLGVYGGFASTLLRIGASGVVAPLWNIEDDVAADVAREVYAAVIDRPDVASPSGVSVAEAFRRVRARYNEEAVRSSEPGVTATLIAFQVFGHPRLRLRKAT